ncbi:hypothetical protein [Nocardioides yefusunii]|uniref:Uncharacterized protein n=1 Tax=Nocardioides yefusunii TaxID=2500546 RepID=A0ABW1QYM3_9ACTN|nr:hypothetical protein [Nocardioides yefusunii]
MPDIDQLLRESAPEVTLPSSLGPAMAATVRTITSGSRKRTFRQGLQRTGTRFAVGVAALSLGAIALVSSPTWFDSPATTDQANNLIDPNASDFVLVATKLAPTDLPLPDGVALQDAIDQVVDQSKASSAPLVESSIAATYVRYAQCQWMRVWIDKQVTPDVASAALESLGDPGAFVAVDGGGVRRLENHEGTGASPDRNIDMALLRSLFEAECTNGLGDAPKADH